MTFTAILMLNLLLDLAILSVLAFVPSRAGRLRPHRAARQQHEGLEPLASPGRLRRGVALRLRPLLG
jgi:hypothetical protein